MIVDLKIEIIRNSDNLLACMIWKDWNYNTVWWEHGSASCDCNREAFFHEALNLSEPTDPECNNGKYFVRLSNNTTGEVLYNEFKQLKEN